MHEGVALPTTHLVIACGDSDHGQNGLLPEIQDFLLKNYQLQMGEYFLLLRDGGPACLAHPEALKIDYLSLKASMRRIRRLKPRLRKVFCFIHGPCGYYQDAVPKKEWDKSPERNDGPRIIRAAEEIMLGLAVEGFFKPNSRQETNFLPI